MSDGGGETWQKSRIASTGIIRIFPLIFQSRCQGHGRPIYCSMIRIVHCPVISVYIGAVKVMRRRLGIERNTTELSGICHYGAKSQADTGIYLDTQAVPLAEKPVLHE